MSKPARAYLFAFLTLILLLCLATILLAGIAKHAEQKSAPVQNTPMLTYREFVLDAGHGGEDGGAIGAHGVIEKEVNLALCREIAMMLKMNGMEVTLTRETDELLYDKTVDYEGRKKVLDLAARERIALEHPDSLFVSIHMNAFPLSEYRGLQVWYSPNHVESQTVAQHIQETVALHLQPDNERVIKRAGSSIYLLYHIPSPAVLIECGFLSNPEEERLLVNKEYQQKLAFLIALSLLDPNSANR